LYSTLSIILVFSAVSILAEDSKELKCLASYLKDKNSSNDFLSSVDYVATSPSCDEIIKNHMKNYQSELAISEESNEFNKCTAEVIEQTPQKNTYILLKAMEEYEVGWKFWQSGSRLDAVKVINKKLKDDIEKIKDYCKEWIASIKH
jgi:hypothetical protein